jgi:hypothetical protein
MKVSVDKEKIIKAIYNEKRLAVIFVVLFVLSLLPLFAIAFYTHPSADDFYYGAETKAAYMETHNIAAVLIAAFEKDKNDYYTWHGRYADTFFTALNPAVFSESLYPVTAFIMLLALVGSTIFLLQTLIVRVLELSCKYVLLTGIPVLFFSIQSLPSPAEGFFYHNNALCYTLFYSLMLFLFGLCIHLYIGVATGGGGGGMQKQNLRSPFPPARRMKQKKN